ncbi:MAG: hypothetical protein RJQ00_06790 [Vicingaceae bacterium]
MKKITLTTFSLALLFVSQTAQAQLSHPHFISLNFGTNIPLSDYKELDSVVLGNANPGLYYSFEAGAFFSKVVGLGVNLGAFTNSVDNEDIIDQLKSDFNNRDEFTVESEDWVNSYLMLGPYLSFGSKAFIVDLKLLGGVMNSAKPLINIESETNEVQLSRSNEVSSLAFGFNYGIHFRIKLVGKLGLRINAEGFMSGQEFETKVQEIKSNSEPTTKNQTLEKDIQALNLGAGLALTF